MNYVFVSFGILFLFSLVFLLGYSLGFKRISARYIQGESARNRDTGRPAREAAIETETEASADFDATMPKERRLPAAGQAGGARATTSQVVGSRKLSSQQQRQSPASAVEQPLAARSYPAGAARLATPASNQVHQQSAAPTAAPVARKGRGQG